MAVHRCFPGDFDLGSLYRLVPEKQLADSLPAEGEDCLEVWGHHESVDESFTKKARDGVVDMVSNQRATRTRLEGMGMNPAFVGAPALFIDEAQRRLPDGDFRLPANWHPVNSESIIDQGARA